MEKVVRGITYRKAQALIKEWRSHAEYYNKLIKKQKEGCPAFNFTYWSAVKTVYLICAYDLEKSLDVKEV